MTDGRKTLGVFMNKAGINFQTTVQKVTQRKARELGYDIFYFFTVGYRESKNYYDVQEKTIFSPHLKTPSGLLTLSSSL